ncbi:helix-turn-helix domain-containing protein [Amphibacillus indicireducens]|uniref:CatDE operon transcriptional regulator CatR n=1 Tax=Amphibacillus indicireducens TaxID=1076330 RepID=A0ABP7V0U0_9BACI
MAEPVICPRFEQAISLLSKRWTGLVIYQLLNGTQRFNELQSAIGVSGKVLSDRLKDLEQQGIVHREVIPDTPVIIHYSLTEKGHSMQSIIQSIESWSQDWIKPSADA